MFQVPELPAPVFEPPPARVYLTGFMGVGKTSAAWHLAMRIGWTFIDLDQLVRVQAQRDIPALFAEGERVFREAERAALVSCNRVSRAVIATGGGALLAPEALALAQEDGTVVYLRLSAEALAVRLAADDAPRPLLDGPDGRLRRDALRARVDALLAERAPRYEEADIVVDVDGLVPFDVARAVLSALDG